MQVHGAALSGIHAAEEIMMHVSSEERRPSGDQMTEGSSEVLPIVVVGAGAAGLFAAAAAQSAGVTAKNSSGGGTPVVVLEAKERHGGRVLTISLPAAAITEEAPQVRALPMSPVQVDMGASWLQQFPDNFLASRARALQLDLHPTDFQDALCAASDGRPVHDLHREVEALSEAAAEAVSATSQSDSHDMSVLEALQPHMSSLSGDDLRLAHLALAGDINSDLGYYLHNTSARHALSELGVGNEDHYVRQGYSALLDPLARDLDIRYNTPVQVIDWSQPQCVLITTGGGEVIRAAACICTVPVSILRGPALTFCPPLPPAHARALSHIHQGKCEKVALRFSSRWWPHSANGLYRWYDNARHPTLEGGDRFSPMLLDWNEWLDLTDCVGAPVVIGFCVGEEACAAHHHSDSSDAEIAAAALQAFQSWAWHTVKEERAAQLLAAERS